MCEPISLTLLGSALGAGQGVAGYYQGQKAAQAQNEVIQAQAEALQDQYHVSTQMTNLKASQTKAAFNADKAARNIQAQKEASRFTVAFAETGAAGVSIDKVAASPFMAAALDIGVAEKNLDNALTQSTLDNWAAFHSTRNSMSVLDKQRSAGPNLWISALGITGSTAGGASTGLGAGANLKTLRS